eukprot:CAMPEP_0194355264 /NCGR_PEP_ID=MMETSP0174-20130528/3203_1 /TAXON_ID=216777 /ORGANISM="Proboscia alata, Strain PI-D3" /LENGTH=886 /DNA_ID=CAMNT_0039124481 /DNA_START=63 /DNA_END=2723 /DNA_ORIENTATION=-
MTRPIIKVSLKVAIAFFYVTLCSGSNDRPNNNNTRKELNDVETSGSTFLSKEDFRSILTSEVDNEFGLRLDDSSLSQESWKDYIEFEWELARGSGETESNVKDRYNTLFGTRNRHASELFTNEDVKSKADKIHSRPFIFCNQEAGKSGYERKLVIEQSLSDIGDDAPRANVISNIDTMTCFYVSTSASVAEILVKTHPDLIVQPLGSIMKMRQGLLKGIVENNANKFSAELCPGVATSIENAERKWGDIIRTTFGKKSETEGTRRPLEAPDQFYWTSKKNSHVRDNLRYPIDQNIAKDLLSQPDRELAWSRVMRGGIKSDHMCMDMFEKMNATGVGEGDEIIITAFDNDSKTFDHVASTLCKLSFVATIATHPAICSMSHVPDIGVMNEEARWIVESGDSTSRSTPWLDSGLTGAGQVVSLIDTGIDVDNCYFWDSTNLPPHSWNDKSNRKITQYVSFADGNDHGSGHGTHVAGTIAGHISTDGGKTSSTSPGMADGIAKDAKISFYDFSKEGKTVDLPSNLHVAFDKGRNAGSKVLNASWGGYDGGSYGYWDRVFDDYIFRKDDFLIVVSAGNSGAGQKPTSIHTPASAKNVISVGATQSSGKDVTRGMKGEDYVAWFSSHGPTADGRTKPDVVAPGESILSAGARSSQRGECDPTDGTVLSVGDVTNAYGLDYRVGTSMAAPVVTGTVALIRQYFEEGWYPSGIKGSGKKITPSGTLVKAIIMNGAQLVAGIQENKVTVYSSEYDNTQNFGRVSLINSLALDGKNKLETKVYDRESITNDSLKNYNIRINTSGCDATELRVTLAWNDPASTQGCTNCVNNDLDLYIVRDGKTYYPNGLNKKDSKNNAERIRIPATNGQSFKVRVKAYNLATNSQKYSLVVSGCF